MAAPDVTPNVAINAQLLSEVASNLREWGEQIVQGGHRGTPGHRRCYADCQS